MDNIHKALYLLGFEIYKEGDTKVYFDQKTGISIPVDVFTPVDYLERMLSSMSKKQMEAFEEAINDDGSLEDEEDKITNGAELILFILENRKKFTEILLKSL